MSQLGLRMDTDGPSGGRGHRGGRRGRRKKAARSRRRGGIAVFLAVVAVLAVVGGGGYLGVHYISSTFFGPTPDYQGAGVSDVQVVIPPNASLTQMGQVLQDAGVVKSAKAFTDAAQNNPQAAGIQPGTYTLKTQMQGSLALAALLDPASLDANSRIIVKGGDRASAVFQQIADKLHVSLQAVQDAATKTPQAVGVPSWATAGVEGLLAPGTYNIQPGMTPTEVLVQMVSAGTQRMSDPSVQSAATALNVTPYQILIIASIVEHEGQPPDYPKVARVILNRIAAKQNLDFDSTVLYAEGKQGTLNVTSQDTAFQSPYNTYLHPGLPPGPIGNPDTSTIQAVLNPTPGNWLYFITVNPATGETDFTDNYQQFLQWKQQFEAYQSQHPSTPQP